MSKRYLIYKHSCQITLNHQDDLYGMSTHTHKHTLMYILFREKIHEDSICQSHCQGREYADLHLSLTGPKSLVMTSIRSINKIILLNFTMNLNANILI